MNTQDLARDLVQVHSNVYTALSSSERILTDTAFLDPAMMVPISKHCLLTFVKERFSHLKMPLMDLNVVTASVLVTS